MPFIGIFNKAINIFDTNSASYDEWICFIKKKCSFVASNLNMHLYHYYYDELDILEKIIINDVSHLLHNTDKYNELANIIFDYAKDWMYEPDNNFYTACDSIRKLGNNKLVKKLIVIAEKNTNKINSFDVGYSEKFGINKKY